MDVRSGTSLWQALHQPDASWPELNGDTKCEVAVIGAGITGALAAHYLVREGVDVVLVDKHQSGKGSTAASTGLLQYEADTPLSELIHLVGEQAAVRSYRLGVQAVNDLEALAAGLSDRCGFTRWPSYYLAGTTSDVDDLRREHECRTHFGFDTRLLGVDELAELTTIKAPAALRSTGDAQIDPLQFTTELLNAAATSGLRRFGRCEVTRLTPVGDGIDLTTATGTIHARRVVVANGYAAHQMLRRDIGSLHSTYAAASEPMATFEGWPESALLWETARPYFYLRTTADGRAVIGGEDTPYFDDHRRDKLVLEKLEKLRRRFHEWFPKLHFEPAFVWAGTFGETKDGLAYIGETPELPHAYFALGYGGNGITFGQIAARIITDLFVRRANADAHVFRFNR